MYTLLVQSSASKAVGRKITRTERPRGDGTWEEDLHPSTAAPYSSTRQHVHSHSGSPTHPAPRRYIGRANSGSRSGRGHLHWLQHHLPLLLVQIHHHHLHFHFHQDTTPHPHSSATRRSQDTRQTRAQRTSRWRRSCRAKPARGACFSRARSSGCSWRRGRSGSLGGRSCGGVS